MNQLLEKKVKRKGSDGTPFNDEYIYVSMKTRSPKEHSRKLMNKMIDKYFKKGEEEAIEERWTLGNKWRNLKSMNDSYMSLSPMREDELIVTICMDINSTRKGMCCIHSRITVHRMWMWVWTSTRYLWNHRIMCWVIMRNDRSLIILSCLNQYLLSESFGLLVMWREW